MGQDLIHSVLTSEKFDSVQSSLNDVSSNLPFLLNLTDDQRVSIVKMGPAYKPLAEIAYGVVRDFPAIFNSLFDRQGYLDDWALYNLMEQIQPKIAALNRAVEDTIMALGSDIMNNTGKVYSAGVKNKFEVPGLAAVVEKMEAFYEKAPKIVTTVAASKQ